MAKKNRSNQPKQPMTKKKKRTIILIVAAALLVAAPGIYYGLTIAGVRPPTASHDKRFAEEIGAQDCWDNTLEERIPGTELYDVMMNHMAQEDTKPRLLFIGYDGALASAVGKQVLADSASTVLALAQQGGLWLGRTGGATPGDQASHTAPGWTSMFTGVWADRHGVFANGDTLNADVRTIMYQLLEKGRQASFSFSWEPHRTDTYKLEAEDYPDAFIYCKDDTGTVDSMLQGIEAGYDAVFGTIEHTDHAGHTTGYSSTSETYMQAVKDCETDAAQLVAAAQTRAQTHGEDWMIIITTDHGGFVRQHYDDTLMETTTFFACNKAIF